MDALLAGEVRQYIAIDRCAADHASLDVALRLDYFLKGRHAARLSHGGKQTAGLAWSPDGFAMLDSDEAISRADQLSLSLSAATKLAR